MFDAEKLAALKRGELQKIAKEHGVRANLRSADIIEELRLKHEAGEFKLNDAELEGQSNSSASDPPRAAAAASTATAPQSEESKADDLSGKAMQEDTDSEAAKPDQDSGALPQVGVRYCVVDGTRVASVQWHQIILRGGRLFVRHSSKDISDCDFVLKPASPVESTAAEEEHEELICDACATLNRQTVENRDRQDNAADVPEEKAEASITVAEQAETTEPTTVTAAVSTVATAAPAAPTPAPAPATPQVPAFRTDIVIAKDAAGAAAKSPRTPLSPWNHRPTPALGLAARSTAKKLPMMTPADRLKERINRAKLEQSAKRDKLLMSRRNIEMDPENVEPQKTDRYVPVAVMMHQRKLPMTATVDAARLNAEDHA